MVSSMYILKKPNQHKNLEDILRSILKHSIISKASAMINCACILCISVTQVYNTKWNVTIFGCLCFSVSTNIIVHCLRDGDFFKGIQQHLPQIVPAWTPGVTLKREFACISCSTFCSLTKWTKNNMRKTCICKKQNKI